MKYKAFLLPVTLLFFSFNIIAQNSNSTNSISTEMDPAKSILKNTETSENHKTLLTVLKAADLEDVLTHDGPFTVFAPSDVAFEKLSKKTMAELLQPKNKKELQALMQYHIVAGNFSASKILRAMCRGGGSASFTTVQGDKLLATMKGVDIILTDRSGHTAKITIADSNQCNGVIHEIDSVIRPSTL